MYADGTLLGSAHLVIAATNQPENAPDVAANTTGYLVTYTTMVGATEGYGTISFRQVRKDGTLGPSDTLAGVRDYYPRVASDGSGFLVAFRREASGGFDIYGATLERSGYVVRAAFPISTATGAQDLPSVAFSGGAYLADWEDQRSGGFDIYAARLAGNGDVLDSSIAVAATAGSYEVGPAVAPAASGAWVVDYQYGSTGQNGLNGAILQRRVAPK